MKKDLGGINALYPSLTTIVGAVVDGKANFMAVAHVGIMNHGTPQYLSFGMAKVHYTNKGIHEHGQFSVNIPCVDQVVETDYVGLVSGKNTDKSGLFDVFYGELPHAPMIQACPVCMELSLDRVLDFDTHDIFVGRVVRVHAETSVLNEAGKIDLARVRPLLFDMTSVQYWSLGEPVARCWNVGKQLKNKTA